MECHVVQDLLPNHVEGLNSPQTDAAIQNHLETCTDCRTAYEKMTTAIPQDAPSSEEVDFLKKLRFRMIQRNVLTAIATFVLVLVGFTIFANVYRIVIPFDPNRMWVELVPMAVVQREDGTSSWVHLLGLPIPYEYKREVASIAFQGIANNSLMTVGRDIIRDGEHVRVVFHRYTQSLWANLVWERERATVRDSGSTIGTRIHGDRFNTTGQEPQRIEIYYLPVRNLNQLNNFSDADFDAQRTHGTLVWSGVN